MMDPMKLLWAEIRDLQRRVTARPPIQIQPSPLPYMFMVIVGGNTLSTGQNGCQYYSGVRTVPTAYDPNVTSTFVNGICRGTLYINGVAQTGYYLLVNDSNASWQNALLAGDRVWCSNSVRVTVDTGGYVTAYTPA